MVRLLIYCNVNKRIWIERSGPLTNNNNNNKETSEEQHKEYILVNSVINATLHMWVFCI